MKQSIFLVFSFLLSINYHFSQNSLAEKDLIGNWKITGGSGTDFEKEMIGSVLTFQKDHHATRMEDGEKVDSEWKFEKNVITITYHYNDGKNEPDIETLTVISLKDQKLTLDYLNEDEENCIFIFEKISAP